MLARSLISKNTVIRTSLVRYASNFVVLGDSSKFSDIIKSDTNKILYFTASWCPPCKKIAPVFEKLSGDFAETTFVKIDIDDHRDLAEEYNISSVPTFKAFVGAKLVSEVRAICISPATILVFLPIICVSLSFSLPVPTRLLCAELLKDCRRRSNFI